MRVKSRYESEAEVQDRARVGVTIRFRLRPG